MFEMTAIHAQYGVQIHNCQLADIISGNAYAEIREAFETHSLLYFSDQNISDEQHLALGKLFGPREDRTIDKSNPDAEVSSVSNVKADGSLLTTSEKRLLDLQSNMLWHTDSTFLPIPALANILIGRVIPPSGTSTEFASTRIAWRDMPEELKERIRNHYFRHQYSHSRRKIDPDLADEKRFTHWGEQIWNTVWKNPYNNLEALYIASHCCGIVGMDDSPALALIDELTDWCTRPQYVYSHQWKVGDVLIWDERAMLHRGVPWNYDEARTLSSICVSTRDVDGLNSMRMK